MIKTPQKVYLFILYINIFQRLKLAYVKPYTNLQNKEQLKFVNFCKFLIQGY